MISDFLRELLRFIVLVLVRPVLKVVVAIVSPIYKALFGWADDRAYRKLQERFEQDIRRSLPWLFDKYEGKVIPNPRKTPRGFDYAVVTVAVDQMLFSFIRGRGELRVEVSPARAPNHWQEIGEVIAAIDRSEASPRYYRLQDFGRFLEQNLDRLKKTLSVAESGGLPHNRTGKLVRL